MFQEAGSTYQVSGKIRNFTDLEAWKIGHKLVLSIYRLTEKFPKAEMFGLSIQLRRAAVSFTSNMAEGFSRATWKDKAHLYSIALGSLTEVENQLHIARDLGYCDDDQFTQLASNTERLNRLTNGLIKKSKPLIPAS
jgi:four helix bundle protein